MSGRILPLSIALALLASGLAALPSGAAAQCRLCGTPATESGAALVGSESVPLRIEVQTDLDFDRLILLSQDSGTALLGPNGEKRATGAVAAMTGRTMVGRILIRGEAGRFVRVDLPDRIEIEGTLGGALLIESVKTDLPAAPQLDGNGELTVRFGGELRIEGDVEGAFRGLVPVVVDYL